MKKLFNFIFFFLLINLTSQKLISVYSIIRHGARSSETFFSDYNAKIYGSYSKITLNGYEQSQNLGRTLRNRYINKLKFLDDKYNNNQIIFKTGLSQRSIFSLYGIISGLYPNNMIEIKYEDPKLINNNFDIPFNKEDQFLSNEPKIPIKILGSDKELNYHPIKFKGGILHPNFSQTQKDIDDAVKNFQKCSKIDSSEKNYDSFNSLTDLYFTYDNNFQKKLKKCIKNTTEISFLKGKLDRWYNKKQQQVKLVEKDIFSKIIKQFEKKPNFFTLYIGHIPICKYIIKSLFNDDFIIETGIKGLNNKEDFNFLICPFSGSFIFELYENEYNNEKYVQILINGKLVKDKNAFVIKDIDIVDGKIPYEKFKQLFQVKIE